MAYDQRCVFLDRDGVLNYDRDDYSWLPDHFRIIPESMGALIELKNAGYKLIVITNQAGISRELYTPGEMKVCHNLLQEACDNAIDAFYYSPYHPTRTESLSRKPGSLLFERAIAKFRTDVSSSWMVGDKERDLVPARSLGLNTILMAEGESEYADHRVKSLPDAVRIILDNPGI